VGCVKIHHLKAHIELTGQMKCLELYTDEALKTKSTCLFKGNMDLDRVNKAIKEYGANKIGVIKEIRAIKWDDLPTGHVIYAGEAAEWFVMVRDGKGQACLTLLRRREGPWIGSGFIQRGQECL
jgi:hypothetical protein